VYLTSLIRPLFSLKNVNSKGTFWFAPYCPSHEIFTVVGVFS